MYIFTILLDTNVKKVFNIHYVGNKIRLISEKVEFDVLLFSNKPLFLKNKFSQTTTLSVFLPSILLGLEVFPFLAS